MNTFYEVLILYIEIIEIYYVTMIVEILVDEVDNCYEYAEVIDTCDTHLTIKRLKKHKGTETFSFDESVEERIELECVNAYLTDDTLYGFRKCANGEYVVDDGDSDYEPESESESESESEAEL